MQSISVVEISALAISEQAGLLLRDGIIEAIGASDDRCVTLDFTGIKVFTTMFFNASIGYFVLTRGKGYINEHIKIVNLSPLGRETLDHSLMNAEIVAKNREQQFFEDMLDSADDMIDD